MVPSVGVQMEENRWLMAVMEKNGDRVTLSQFALLPRNREEPQPLAVHFTRERLDPYKVAMSLPAREAMLRKFSIEVGESKDLDDVIHYAAEPYIATRPIEELTVAYHVLHSGANGTRVLVAAMTTERVQSAIAEIEAQGVYPPVILLDAFALWHTALACGIAPLAQTVLVLDVRAEVGNSLLIHDRKIMEMRAIPLKVQSLREALSADVAETTELSLAALHDGTTSPLTPQRKVKIWNKLGKEVRRTCLSAPEITQIYLCGEPEILQDMPVALEKELALPVTLWDVGQAITIAPDVPRHLLPLAPVAIGLALTAQNDAPDSANFRHGALSCAKTWDIVKRPLAWAMTAVFWLLLVLGIVSDRQSQTNLARYAHLCDQAQTIAARLQLEAESLRGSDPLLALRRAVEDRLAEAASAVPALPDNFTRLSAILEVLDKTRQKHYFTISHIAMSDTDIVLEGKCETDLCLDDLKAKCKSLPMVQPGENSTQISSRATEPGANPRLTRQFRIAVMVRGE